MGLLNDHPMASAIGVLVIAYLARSIYRLIKIRRRFKNLVSSLTNFEFSNVRAHVLAFHFP
ncbi:hypothetical protein K469DRAFT_717121 [Zopfia rhizophila CBS 207.26]|uniref:Uncharacterized protein n=1 Tax=Zopfia rhizophila CBS 207.26 TaxID=1314779 RepID=A0A6A6ER50_9PEZI|nr:hypothetical protein K469DRAFT_717121 [Zopfia rhizophila CBS 207.26]